MAEHPIIFSTDMVRAILDGRKTQTRRIIKARKLHPDYGKPVWDEAFVDGKPPEPYLHVPFGEGSNRTVHRHFPKWEVGDTLYVKEGYRIKANLLPRYMIKVFYIADGNINRLRLTEKEWNLWNNRKYPYRNTPGRFMYKSLARIFLEITNIRVERVQDISEKDAIAEGITDDELIFTCLYDCANRNCDKIDGKTLCDIYHTEEDCWQTEAFGMLWDSLNAKRGYGWDKNPWVWVIEFKRDERR